MNTFQQIYTGGACNPNELQRGRGFNPFTKMVDMLITGKAANQQVLEGFRRQEEVPPEVLAMQGVWGDSVQMDKNFHLEQMRMQELAFQEARLHEEERLAMERGKMMEMQHIMNAEWQKGEGNEWAQDLADQEAQKHFDTAFKEAESTVDSKVDEKEALQAMMSVMMNDPDPKFQNSKFLDFLKKVNTGEIEIKNNQVIEHPEKAQDLEFENAFKEAEQKVNEEMKTDFNQVYQEEEIKDEKEPLNAEKFQKAMEDNWRDLLLNFQDKSDEEIDKILSEQWQTASDIEEMQYVPPSDKYQFSDDNPLLKNDQPMQTALQLLNIGETNSAVLAIEAYLQNNPLDPHAWRLLGIIHQDNDQDSKAVQCLKKSIELEPSNLDTLIALGVSCTNTVDEVSAMGYLRDWIVKNPKYAPLNINPDIVYEKPLNQDYTTEEIKGMNQNLINSFLQGLQIDSQDVSLLSALAVLYFISRNYDESVKFFGEAVKHDPTNYSLYNKLAATLAHLQRTSEAMEFYHKALDLKPNYVRVWVNLGIAHAFLKEYHEAARFYLTALSLNPGAKHLWSYLESTLICDNRYDLLPRLKNMNINDFRDEFDIPTIAEIPPPDQGYNGLIEEFYLKRDTDEWIQEYLGKQLTQVYCIFQRYCKCYFKI